MVRAGLALKHEGMTKSEILKKDHAVALLSFPGNVARF
jgi:hypothetical protein